MDDRTEYKYIEFSFVDSGNSKKGGVCWNKKSKTVLGYWEYYKPWKQYVIEFLEDCVFNETCLKDIADFLSKLNKDKQVKDKDNEQNTT